MKATATASSAKACSAPVGDVVDKADVTFVYHLGAPPSPIAYYQQVGRAGRGRVDAEVVLLPTAAEERIWAYFDSTSMPPRRTVEEVLRVLERSGPCTVAVLESQVNLRRGRLEALLKILDVDGVVDRDGSEWFRTAAPWVHDEERFAALAAARRAEQEAILDTYMHALGMLA